MKPIIDRKNMKVIPIKKIININVFYFVSFFRFLYKVVVDWLARRLRGKRGFQDALYRTLTPISHYLLEWKIIRNTVFIHSERFLAITSFLMAVTGTIFLLLESPQANTAEILKGLTFFLFVSILLSPYFSFNLSRANSKEFVQALSGGKVKDSSFIKNTAYEAYRVVEYVYRYVGDEYSAEEVGLAVQRMKDSISICDEAKIVLASRLRIKNKDLSDDFLKFSSSIFINRCNKFVDLKNIKTYKVGEDKFLKENAKCDAMAIVLYIEEIKRHLWDIIHCSIDLNNFSLIFQTRSVSGATRQLIKFIQNERENIKDFSELRLIINLQKAHRTGSSAHKAIGLAISSFLRKANTTEEDELILIRRISCMSDWYLNNNSFEKHNDKLSDYLDCFEGWHEEADKLVSLQRREIASNFIEHFDEFYKSHGFSSEKKGTLYIVMSSYSRAVRAIIRHVISKNYSDQIQYVICAENIKSGDYSAQLMYQQILEEFLIGSEGEKLNSIYWNTWRSSFEELEDRLIENQDSVLYLAGCDQIDLRYNQNEEVTTSIYKYSPITILNRLKKKNINITAMIVGGEYKYELNLLTERLPEHVKYKVREILPKQRRSGLHEWITSPDGVKVQLICSNLLEEDKKCLEFY